MTLPVQRKSCCPERAAVRLVRFRFNFWFKSLSYKCTTDSNFVGENVAYIKKKAVI